MNRAYPILIARHLRVGYDDGPDIISDLSLEIHQDDIIGVIGQNGSGKTTLVKALLGILPLRSGTVQYYSRDGKQISYLDVGYVPQRAKLDHQFPINVYDVVASGNIARNHFKPNLHDKLATDSTLERLKISHLSKKPISALSGGELQRVILARALVSRPILIIMDEPTTYVDESFAEQLYQLIPEIKKDSALLIVSHNIEKISNIATKIIQL